MNRFLAVAAFAILLSGCQRGIPEVWPKTYAEYAAMSEQQKLEIKGNCMKYRDEAKGVYPPSCWLSRPKLIMAKDLETYYQRELAEWDAYKNAQ